MNENIFLSIVGVIIAIVPAWKMIKSKSNFVYNTCLVALGIFVIIASIHKERKDTFREQAYQYSDSLKNKKIDDLIFFRYEDSIRLTKTHFSDSIQNIYNRKYIIDSLNLIHEMQLASLQVRIDSLLKKTLNKRISLEQKKYLLGELAKHKGVKCVYITNYPFTDPKLADQVLALLAEYDYEIMGNAIAIETNSSSFNFVSIMPPAIPKDLPEAVRKEIKNPCISIKIGAF